MTEPEGSLSSFPYWRSTLSLQFSVGVDFSLVELLLIRNGLNIPLRSAFCLISGSTLVANASNWARAARIRKVVMEGVRAGKSDVAQTAVRIVRLKAEFGIVITSKRVVVGGTGMNVEEGFLDFAYEARRTSMSNRVMGCPTVRTGGMG